MSCSKRYQDTFSSLAQHTECASHIPPEDKESYVLREVTKRGIEKFAKRWRFQATCENREDVLIITTVNGEQFRTDGHIVEHYAQDNKSGAFYKSHVPDLQFDNTINAMTYICQKSYLHKHGAGTFYVTANNQVRFNGSLNDTLTPLQPIKKNRHGFHDIKTPTGSTIEEYKPANFKINGKKIGAWDLLHTVIEEDVAKTFQPLFNSKRQDF